MFSLDWLLHGNTAEVIDEVTVAGRAGIAVEARDPAGMLLRGSDRCVCVLDRLRRILLSCEAWLGDELLMVEELTEVEFDVPLPKT